jgi:integrase
MSRPSRSVASALEYPRLLRQGVNPKFVQELLGHANISMTLNVYSHVLPDMGDAVASAMDDALE